jgi:hypothetical protein
MLSMQAAEEDVPPLGVETSGGADGSAARSTTVATSAGEDEADADNWTRIPDARTSKQSDNATMALTSLKSQGHGTRHGRRINNESL